MKSTLCRAYLNVFDATLDSTFALGLSFVEMSIISTTFEGGTEAIHVISDDMKT